MNPITALVPVLVLPFVLGACGGDTEPTAPASTVPEGTSTSTPVEPPPTSEEPAQAAATGEMPTYDEVKAIYLATTDETSQASCASGSQDVDVATAPGETYTRFVCGDIERFDYVVGAEAYADNYPTAIENDGYRAVFHVPGEMYVKPSGANEDLAPAIAEACGCGEVVDVILE